jgi:uncharacterized protein DUF6544
MQSERIESVGRGAGIAPSRKMRARFLREVAAARLPLAPAAAELVTEADLSALPATVQRYLRFMGVVGRPRTWSFRLHANGLFRMGPDSPWMPCEAWQYDSSVEVARIFHMRVRFGGIVPMYVRDTYVRGRGHMVGRLLDVVPVVDESDERLAIGELVTYLNDAILMAPSMLLGPSTIWTKVDHSAFDVALTDRGRTVTARVFVNGFGTVTDFSTSDRFGSDPASPGALVRARWSTPVYGWVRRDGRAMPTHGSAVWHFPGGDFTYADFQFSPGALELDVAPGAPD